MAGSALMSLGTRTMFAAQAGMQVTGHNIANASVEGYSRQRVELATAKGQFTGAGFFGKGADVVSIVRTYDDFLTRHAAAMASQSAFDQARLDRLERMEQAFPMGESGIGYAAEQMFSALSDLASRPGDIPTRQVVLARANELAARFNTVSQQLDSLQAGVNADLELEVRTINELATSIASINDQIAAVSGLGQPPNDLLDKRDQLIQTLSSHIAVSAVPYEDGTYGIFIAGGQALVLGGDTTRLAAIAHPEDPRRSTVGVVDGTTARVLAPEMLASGSVGGLLRFQDEDLMAARGMIDELAQAVADAVNAQHVQGRDLDGNAGLALFDTSGGGGRAAEYIRLAFTDPRQVAAASTTSDNGNALALVRLREQPIVSGTWYRPSTVGEAWATTMGEIGVRVQGARAAAGISASVARQAREARDMNSGVNLDEEAARLIQYQQAYQAAAKVLQIAQSVFQTLLDTATR